ncbi:AraC family transcriptional regulator [Paenibacillus sp. 1P07SE]|uniref:AraC family transcriptional regulator n=1 Tax=Paenibacillus sp. 1P07SE TaxID=3132209 RepID=UPI0039A4A4AA
MMTHTKQRTAAGTRLFVPSLRAAAGSYNPQERFCLRTGRLYAFGIILKGSVEIVMDGKRQIVRARSAFLLPPGTLAYGQALGGQPLRYRVLLFHCVVLAGRGSDWRTGPARLPAAIGPALATGAAELFDALKTQERHMVCFLLARLLQRYLAELSEQPAGGGGIEAAAAYMDKHFTESLQVEQLAGIAGYSPNHFTKLFKSAMDCTPVAYLTKLRIERAKQLMLTSGSMKEVASEVGYRDEHYFSRVFKQATGVAPTIYIKTCHRRVAALYYGLDECLQTLGLQPVASLSYTRRIAQPVLSPSALPHGLPPQPQTLRLDSIGMNYEALLRSRPELLITSDLLADEAARMREIAPVALLKHSYDWQRPGGRAMDRALRRAAQPCR